MRNLKTIAMSAVLIAGMTGGAFALDQAGKANTMDPNSAPKAENHKAKKTTGAAVNDNAAKANTADPGSAPGAKDGMAKRGNSKSLDAAGRANTVDPNSSSK
jgi:hypothetical protein